MDKGHVFIVNVLLILASVDGDTVIDIDALKQQKSQSEKKAKLSYMKSVVGKFVGIDNVDKESALETNSGDTLSTAASGDPKANTPEISMHM